MNICSYLDPRTKSLPYLTPAERSHIHDKVHRALVEGMDEDCKELGGDTVPDKTDKQFNTMLDSMFDDKTQCVSSTTADQVIKRELDVYLIETRCPMSQCPLAWWKSKTHQFPHVAKLAQKYLAIQGTSVPSERLFSTAGSVISDRRSRLQPDVVNMLLFLNKNA